jgi:CBS domain containing-hemolysin-like protein
LASLGLGWLGEPFLADMIEPFFALANIGSPVLIDTVSFALAFGTITTLKNRSGLFLGGTPAGCRRAL